MDMKNEFDMLPSKTGKCGKYFFIFFKFLILNKAMNLKPLQKEKIGGLGRVVVSLDCKG
jgi:hypothetical protein